MSDPWPTLLAVGTLISFEKRKGMRRTSRSAPAQRAPSALDCFETGCAAESRGQHVAAIVAYTEALSLDPSMCEAHVNLGRLLHELGRLGAAEGHYRLAIVLVAGHRTAWFNLGVALEDQDRLSEAVGAYRMVISLDPGCTDAHYNLSGLLERLGDERGALRHLSAHRRLRLGRGALGRRVG